MENNQVVLNKENNQTETIVIAENVVVFTKPFLFEGKEYPSLEFDLDSLSGEDIEAAEVQFFAKNPQIAAQTPLKEVSKGYLAILAAKAAKVPVELIRKLPAKEYSKVTIKVQAFLLKQD